MIHLDLRILDYPEPGKELPGPWPDLVGADIIHLHPKRACILEKGTAMGKPTVMLLAETNEGKWVNIETTLAMLDTIFAAARGAEQRWADRDNPPAAPQHQPV